MVGIEIKDTIVEDDIYFVRFVQHANGGMSVARVQLFPRRTGQQRDLRFGTQRLRLDAKA